MAGQTEDIKGKEKIEKKKALDIELDLFEKKIQDLKVLYEQYFVDVIPYPPDKEHKELTRLKRRLYDAPFKKASSKFRLRMLLQSLQTYETYWNRVLTQREKGTYKKDIFRAQARQEARIRSKKRNTAAGKRQAGMEQLFNSYKSALKKVGANSSDIKFDDFKKSIVKQTREFKQRSGSKKVNYKILIKNGKVSVKAGPKD